MVDTDDTRRTTPRVLGLGRYTDTSMYQDTWPDDMRIDTCYVISILTIFRLD